MNILHIYKDYFPVVGGIENHVKMLAEAQSAGGHKVTVLVNSKDACTRVETINGVRVIYAGRWATISSTPLGFALPRLLARETPEITHLHFPYPWGELSHFFAGRRQHTVITYHSDIIRQKYLRALYKPLMWLVLARASRLIAASPNFLQSSPVLQKLKDKCLIVPYGIDQSPFEHPDAHLVEKIRSRAGVTLESHLLLFVGVLRYYKGLDYLLRALVGLPRAKLLVVGTGPMESAWLALTRDLGLENRVMFVGAVDRAELPAYYAACDTFVLPASNRAEAFGIVQLEAMAAGKPVICTEVGTGTSFVNSDGETGFVVPPRDSEALASGIARLIADEKLRSRMGASGRLRVKREFTSDRMVERVIEVYREVLC